jgi:hypothetical protein
MPPLDPSVVAVTVWQRFLAVIAHGQVADFDSTHIDETLCSLETLKTAVMAKAAKRSTANEHQLHILDPKKPAHMYLDATLSAIAKYHSFIKENKKVVTSSSARVFLFGVDEKDGKGSSPDTLRIRSRKLIGFM